MGRDGESRVIWKACLAAHEARHSAQGVGLYYPEFMLRCSLLRGETKPIDLSSIWVFSDWTGEGHGLRRLYSEIIYRKTKLGVFKNALILNFD
jgi:hypothetical protein